MAEAADNIVSALDQNVGAHLPNDTVATEVEFAALALVKGLLRLNESEGAGGGWNAGTLTTGATASNILGLACGREWIIRERGGGLVGEVGLLRACKEAGVEELQVLTSGGHSSLGKAASIIGLGRESVKELPVSENEPWKLDIDAVEKALARSGVASIVSVSLGEVNTGMVAVDGLEDMKRLRMLADKHRAWIHVDGGNVLSA